MVTAGEPTLDLTFMGMPFGQTPGEILASNWRSERSAKDLEGWLASCDTNLVATQVLTARRSAIFEDRDNA